MIESIKIGCTEHTLAILLMLLGAFLLGLLLGYLLWYGYRKLVAGLEAEKAQQHAKLIEMEKDYMALKYKFDESQKDNAGLKVSLSNCEADKMIIQGKLDNALTATVVGVGTTTKTPAQDSKPTGYAAYFKPDNLQIIEGIGPKIEKVLHESGINSWSALAGKSADQLRTILDNAGPQFKINDPTTWPKQAELAASAKWDELIQYQKFLDTGRENVGDFANDSKLEKMAMKLMAPKMTANDLKIVEGIGPKIEQLLKDAGIKTWADLAAAPLDRLNSILENAGERFRLADPTTWAKQAGLAVDGKWDELRAYQDFLQGGKEA
jgi:predicted flap endonuclease-1-like 5' DNA nuclease